MVVRVNEPRVAAELQAALRRAGCIADVRDGVELTIAHPVATDTAEAETEIEFFLRAWVRHSAPELELSTAE